MREVDSKSLAKLKQWEGLRLTAYKDSGGVLTIGYGHTSDLYCKVLPGDHIDEAKADDLLRHDIAEAEMVVAASVKVPLSDPQFGALVSFAYNVGTEAFRKSSLLRKLNAGDYDAVPRELARWNKDNGKVEPGLTNRRAAEAGLWASGAYVSSASAKASTSTPLLQTVAQPEALAAATTLGGGALAAASGTGPMAYAVAAVIILAAVVAVVLIVKKERQA